MHTMVGKTAVFFFDGGLINGDLIINPLDEHGNFIDFDREIRISANDILKLVAEEYIKDELIGRVENMDWEELLNKGAKL